MSLNQSALLELTETLRTADDGDMMCSMLGFMLQALVDAEAISVIGAAPRARRDPGNPAQRHPRHDRLDDQRGPGG